MGKFNEYSQKATPADNDTLMIYDATSKANKLSPFSGIWNWIVGKLTNAVISNLQTSNKTVVGALNELNSKSSISIKEVIRYKGDDSIMNVTNIPNNTVYFRILMMDKMHPVLLASGGILVGYLLQPDYCRQMFYSSQVIASRTCYGGEWSDWTPINSEAVSTYDMGKYCNDYTFAKFLQEKQGIGITILSGYTGYMFSDLPADLSEAVNVITYKGNDQETGIYSQGFISDSLGHRYTFAADASFSNITFNKF